MSKQPLIVENLSISFGGASVVRHVSFRIEPGKVVALVGESGSGKSVLARTLVGLEGDRAVVQADRLSYGELDLLKFSDRQWRRLRGKDIGFVLQDALVSLDPVRTVGQEIAEALSAHGSGNRRDRARQVVELLQSVGVPEPEIRSLQRPGELSGGLRQRALIASALALDPAILIADEPTSALDSTVQAQILGLLEAIKARGNGLLIISHDLNLVSRIADEVIVLNHGDVVEHGPAKDVLCKPRHAYTRSLLDAVPGMHPRGTRLSRPQDLPPLRRTWGGPPVLEVTEISKNFLGPRGAQRRAVDRVSFLIGRGRTLGIVGESGSGKTTIARIVLGLISPDEGRVDFLGAPWASESGVDEAQRRARRRDIGVIYQDPLSSFDPRWNVATILSDALDASGVSRDEHSLRIRELLAKVRLDPDVGKRWPLELSGGQRQRVSIARAIASNPKIVICDEPVSALDLSVQAQVLDLLTDLQDELGISYLFISHDLGVIRHVSDEMLVMRHGEVLERGPTEEVFGNPQHDFTRLLLAASKFAA